MVDISLPGGEWTYDPDRPLGEPGGFGAVFEGEGGGGQPVAVKRLHLDAEAAAHRELRIAEDLAGRQFSHVIPTYDAGQDAKSGRYFVVMARASRSLQQELRTRGSLPEEEAIEVLRAIARGLGEVQNIVHRDLKPANVLLHEGNWKISDFGIARFVEEATSANTLRDYLTTAYAAPEQWRGERSTNATDIYALGCIAYALLHGRPPFAGPETPDYRDQHLNEAPPALEGVSPALKSLITMTLRKVAETRPRSDRLLRQLDRIAEPQNRSGGAGLLAEAGAALAEREAIEEARKSKEEERARTRGAIGSEALSMLRTLMDDLFQRIRDQAPTARLDPNGQILTLGSGELRWSTTHETVPEGAFAKSGWDVVVGAKIGVTQESGAYRGRSASLWYARLPPEPDYRWHEVPYMANPFASGIPRDQPFALERLDDADIAASNIMSTYQLAVKDPLPIDDEDFDDFSDRWMSFIAKAANNQLAHPSVLPEN